MEEHWVIAFSRAKTNHVILDRMEYDNNDDFLGELSQDPFDFDPGRALEEFPSNPKVKRILHIEEMVRECIGDGIPLDDIIEYMHKKFAKADLPHETPASKPSHDQAKPCNTKSLPIQTVLRLVEKIIGQPKNKQLTDFRILRDLLDTPRASSRRLARLASVRPQTVINRKKIYQNIMLSEPEDNAPQIEENIIKFVLLWVSSHGKKFSISAFKAKYWSEKIMLHFADRLYPACRCHVPRRYSHSKLPKNVMRLHRQTKPHLRPLHLCPKCMKKHHKFHAFQIATSAGKDGIVALTDFINDLRSDSLFLSRFFDVRRQLSRKFGYCIFDRLTPVASENFMCLFQPAFAEPSFRAHMLVAYSENNESRLVHLAISLADRILMVEWHDGFALDDVEAFPALDRLASKIVARREQKLTPAPSTPAHPQVLLNDPVIRQELKHLLPTTE